jgi:hypothetical protein
VTSSFRDLLFFILQRSLLIPGIIFRGPVKVFLPLSALSDFIEQVRSDFLKHKTNFIYGTVRFIQQDKESFMPWAKGDFACVIFNLHTPHNKSGIQNTRQAFNRLIQQVCEYQGAYYLTYDNYASREQTLHCYPEMEQFLSKKLQYDPQEVFQNNWYRLHKGRFI